MRRGQLQHRALDHAVFTYGLFGFAGEILQSGGEVFPRLLVMRQIMSGIVRRIVAGVGVLGGTGGGGGSLSLFGLVLLFRRRIFSCDGGGGFGVVSGGLVEQGHASLVTDAGPALRTAG